MREHLTEGDKVAVMLEALDARPRYSGSVVQRTAGTLRSDRAPLSAEELRKEVEQGIAEEVRRRMDE